MRKPPRTQRFRVFHGRQAAGHATVDTPPESWIATGEGLEALTDAELGKVLLEYVLLPQPLGAVWNAVLYEVVYRLLGQYPRDPGP